MLVGDSITGDISGRHVSRQQDTPPSTSFVNACNTHAHKNDITSSITASKKVMVITGKCIKFNVG